MRTPERKGACRRAQRTRPPARTCRRGTLRPNELFTRDPSEDVKRIKAKANEICARLNWLRDWQEYQHPPGTGDCGTLAYTQESFHNGCSTIVSIRQRTTLKNLSEKSDPNRQSILNASSDCSTIGAQTNRGRPMESQKSQAVLEIGRGTISTSTAEYFASREPSFPDTRTTPSGVCLDLP